MTVIGAPTRLLRLDEAAKRCSYSVSSLRRAIRRGDLAAVRLGPTEQYALRISEHDLERWIQAGNSMTRRNVQMSTSGNGSFVDSESESASGRGSFVDDPAERDGTSLGRAEAVEPAPLAGIETDERSKRNE